MALRGDPVILEFTRLVNTEELAIELGIIYCR